MTFYKLKDVTNGDEVYVNAKSLEWYIYHEKYVEINLSSGDYLTVPKSEFENMMFMEGVKELWNTQHTIA